MGRRGDTLLDGGREEPERVKEYLEIMATENARLSHLLVLRCLASWTNAHRILGDLGEARRLVDAIEWFRRGIGGKAEA